MVLVAVRTMRWLSRKAKFFMSHAGEKSPWEQPGRTQTYF
jgi:hypothetical protein